MHPINPMSENCNKNINFMGFTMFFLFTLTFENMYTTRINIGHVVEDPPREENPFFLNSTNSFKGFSVQVDGRGGGPCTQLNI